MKLPLTPKYSDGKRPKVGDVVRCVDAPDDQIKVGELYKVCALTNGYIMLANGAEWWPERFALVERLK